MDCAQIGLVRSSVLRLGIAAMWGAVAAAAQQCVPIPQGVCQEVLTYTEAALLPGATCVEEVSREVGTSSSVL